MSTAGADDETLAEVEALQAVYGDDCHLLADSPPHLAIHLRPRTADESSLQFVEIILGIKLSSEYPNEPPSIYAVDTKGLDESRQSYLISSIEKNAHELSSSPMLLTLCEEAVDVLTNMNHPAGDCALCLYPFVVDDKSGSPQPFMKLMSCYHCFHSECILRWWGWSQEQNGYVLTETPSMPTSRAQAGRVEVNQQKGFCPVCRRTFDEEDIEHVAKLLGEKLQLETRAADQDGDEADDKLIFSEFENLRRQKFKELLNIQKERNGLIEPKKDLTILPGMYVSLPPAESATADECNTEKQRGEDDKPTTVSTSETRPADATDTSSSTQSNSKWHRKHRGHVAKRNHQRGTPARQQWVAKGRGHGAAADGL